MTLDSLMEPLAHTLVGASLAQTRLGRKTPAALGILLAAANLPDIDVATYLVGADFALAHRRGWTHGLPAVVVLPLLLTALVVGWRRWRGRKTDAELRRAGPVLLLALVGIATHPALDWLNTYGMRFLMPFDPHWSYGDAVFIVDPWLWLILGGSLFLIHSRRRRSLWLWLPLGALTSLVVLVAAPRRLLAAKLVWLAGLGVIAALRLSGRVPEGRRQREQLATLALTAATTYILLLILSTAAARPLVQEEVRSRLSGPFTQLMVGPEPVNPFTRDVVVGTPSEYRFGRFSWLPSPRLELSSRRLPRHRHLAIVPASLAAPEVRGMVTWMRYPFFEVEASGDGFDVYILDARYTRRRTTGFGGARVHIPGPGGPSWPQSTVLDFLGQATLPTGHTFGDLEVGGLSGITYDARRRAFHLLSDDRRASSPARFFTMEIDLEDGLLKDGDIRTVGVTVLRTPRGSLYPQGQIDPEAICTAPRDSLWIASEGDPQTGVQPFLRLYARDGRYLEELPLPSHYLVQSWPERGIRRNLAFESVAATPDGAVVFTATEAALAQDGPEADLATASPARLLIYDAESGTLRGEHLYWVDPVTRPPAPRDAFRVSGLVELVALDPTSLLALERSYSAGVGNDVKLYHVSLVGADDIRKLDQLGDIDRSRIRPVRKTLLLDLAHLGIELDNLEAMTFGPPLADGRPTLVLVSDNNFSPTQVTQFLAFALSPPPPIPPPDPGVTISAVQGATHRSPYRGGHVEDTWGVVTAVAPGGESGFWLQDPAGDGDPATSEALFVVPGGDSPALQPGDALLVTGQVEERGRPGELTTTVIADAHVMALSRGNWLPPPILIGEKGRPPPRQVVDDDALALFDPRDDGIDFYESLEGMLVRVEEPLVVGPTNRFGEIVVAADGGRNASPRSVRGGLLVRPDDFNPERILIDDLLVPDPPQVAVGARLADGVVGVLDYSFANYKLLNTRRLTTAGGGAEPELTPLVGEPDWLTVATYNVENLSAADDGGKLRRLAESVVHRLRSPDILALQEIQDDSGGLDDGVVRSTRTLQELVTAIRRAGGPAYEWRQIDPQDNQDGGRPGANIRVVLLFAPGRVRFVDRGQPGPTVETTLRPGPNGPELLPSPGRIGATHPAFGRDPHRGFAGTRKPLVGELQFNGHRLFVVALHLKSKGGDDRLFGAHQPPRRPSEVQRRLQARVVHSFVQELLELDPEANVIVLGDLNEHPFRPPVTLLVGEGLDSLMTRLPDDDRYSFIFNGNSQLLDYILVSRGLLAGPAADVDIVHANADRPQERRASDHDPVVARFYLPPSR